MKSLQQKERPAAGDINARVIRGISRDPEDVDYIMEYTAPCRTAAAAKKPAMRGITVEVGRTLEKDEDPWRYAALDLKYVKKRLEQAGIAVEEEGKDTLHFANSAKNTKNASPEKPESGKNEKRRTHYI